ncbi:MAG: alpha-L-fucosidase [Tannerella sp.]|jgi:alpha-L-fucosidase|nr:alpha-L-fucosidase [Tannerella sp.]
MKTYKLLILLIIASFLTPVKAQQVSLSLPSEKADWFRDAKFGMFIHFGLYSMLEGSYNGRTLPDTTLANGKSWYAEWIQMRLEVPSEEYKKLADSFNPKDFDADEWIREAKNAGMRYFVITAKHHDGFALWDSKVSDFTIMNSPYKKDMIAELVTACKKYGLKYGFYYSHWQDWEYPGGAMPFWYPKVPDNEFESFWQKKSLPQVKELITMFDPDLLWFDTWDWETHITDQRRDELIALVRSLSPKCLINGRISYLSPGDNIDFLEMHDNQYPDKILEKPWQTPATMMHSWGWHAKDYNWKPSQQMIGYLANNTSKGGNYLLNVGPKPDGSFPVPATRRLREIGAWMLSNNESIYGTQPVKDIEPQDGLFFAQKMENGKRIIYIFMNKYREEIEIPFELSLLTSCTILESGMPLVAVQTAKGSKIQIPERLGKDCAVQVFKIVL